VRKLFDFVVCLFFKIETTKRYDPKVGIYGMDFYVVLSRPGYRVAVRRRTQNKVGVTHRVTREEAIQWFEKQFDGVAK
jgi:large subunit ribosomal protein L11e